MVARSMFDRPEIAALVVVHDPVPVAEVDLLPLRVEHRRRRDSLSQRLGEDERLERGARLPLALDGEVELALAVVVAADHRAHGPVTRIDRDERRGGPVRGRQPLRDRLARHRLQLEVDRRLHPQAAAEHLRRPVLVDQLLLDVVDEVLRWAFGAGQPHLVGLGQRRRVRLVELRQRDLPLLVQALEDDRAPRPRLARVRHRVVARGVGRHAGEQRRLRDRHPLDAVAEVGASRLLDAVGAVAEVDRVQVRLEDAAASTSAG